MDEKRALAGLWAVPGVGPKTVRDVRRRFELAQLADMVIGEWCDQIELPTYAAERIPRGNTLGELGDAVFDRASTHCMKIAWHGEKEYPARLATISDAPPMLFYWGPGTDAPPRRRVAMVGTRKPDTPYLDRIEQLVAAVASKGIGVVSGAALGIDTLAHSVSAGAGGETWAFVGSSLDRLDPHPLKLWRALAPHGATFWSELPPGVRAEPQTFPRRNRLISGASDAVVVLRADIRSGTKYTVGYARKQGRKLLAYPGRPEEQLSQMPLAMLNAKVADLCLWVGDVMRAVGVSGYESHVPESVEKKAVDLSTLSENARAALAALAGDPKCFDELVVELSLRSGQLVAALFELTMGGLVVEHPGKRYEKV